MNCTNELCHNAAAYKDGGCYWHATDRSQPTSAHGIHRLKYRRIRSNVARVQLLRQSAMELVGPANMRALVESPHALVALDVIADRGDA